MGGGWCVLGGADQSRSFQYGSQMEKLQRQLALEKEIQMRLQDEVKLPLGPAWAVESPWPRAGNSSP